MCASWVGENYAIEYFAQMSGAVMEIRLSYRERDNLVSKGL